MGRRRQAGAKQPRRPSKGYIISRSGFAKISAVEDIRTTATMDALFREFESDRSFQPTSAAK